MAIGTLALCYNNEQVFRGVVKLRRGKMLSLRNYVGQSLTSIYEKGKPVIFYYQRA